MEFRPTEGQVAVAKAAREFAEKEMRPAVMKHDESQEFPFEIVRKLGELGFMGMTWPEELEGAGLGDLEAVAVIEELARVDPSIALAAGRKLGAWGRTEPGSGSDSGGMRTTARPEGDGWVLNGSKTFITQGSVGGTYVVMAVTGPGEGKKGISAFIVPRGLRGFTIGKKENKLGMRSSDTATLLFDDVALPGENLLGSAGAGFRQALAVLDGGRIGIAALSVGLAQGALDASIAYAKGRHQFGRALAEFQAIQWKIAGMATEINAARLMTHRAAWLKSRGEPFSLAASQAKYFASEAAVRAANEAVQIHGGYGFIKEYPVEKFYRDVKLMTIGEGTSEVQKMIIARHVLQD